MIRSIPDFDLAVKYDKRPYRDSEGFYYGALRPPETVYDPRLDRVPTADPRPFIVKFPTPAGYGETRVRDYTEGAIFKPRSPQILRAARITRQEHTANPVLLAVRAIWQTSGDLERSIEDALHSLTSDTVREEFTELDIEAANTVLTRLLKVRRLPEPPQRVPARHSSSNQWVGLNYSYARMAVPITWSYVLVN